MGLMQGGKNAQAGGDFLRGQDVLYTPNKVGVNYAVVLDDPDEESLVSQWVGCFTNGGFPLNASWLYAGAEDPANILGIKPSQQVWVWLAVSEGGRLTPKLYAMPSARYQMLKREHEEWGALGLVIKIQKETRAWTIAGGKIPVGVRTETGFHVPGLQGADAMHINDEVLAQLRGECIRDTVKLAQMLGPVDENGDPSVEGIWKMLIRRAEKATGGKVTTKAGVIKMFGKDPAEFGIADEDGLSDF